MEPPSFAEQIASLPNVGAAIADSLAELIFAGKLRPGERLVQARLAEQFGVSRLPVRDALHLLEQRSLAVTRPRRGVVVRPVSRRGVRDIFAVRGALEPLALEEIVGRLDEVDLEKLESIVAEQSRAVEAGDVAGAASLDQRFHGFLYSRAANALLKEVIQILWARIRQIRSATQASGRGVGIGRRSVARHRQLLEALRARDLLRTKVVTMQILVESEQEILGELQRLGWVEGETDEAEGEDDGRR